MEEKPGGEKDSAVWKTAYRSSPSAKRTLVVRPAPTSSPAAAPAAAPAAGAADRGRALARWSSVAHLVKGSGEASGAAAVAAAAAAAAVSGAQANATLRGGAGPGRSRALSAAVVQTASLGVSREIRALERLLAALRDARRRFAPLAAGRVEAAGDAAAWLADANARCRGLQAMADAFMHARDLPSFPSDKRVLHRVFSLAMPPVAAACADAIAPALWTLQWATLAAARPDVAADPAAALPLAAELARARAAVRDGASRVIAYFAQIHRTLYPVLLVRRELLESQDSNTPAAGGSIRSLVGSDYESTAGRGGGRGSPGSGRSGVDGGGRGPQELSRKADLMMSFSSRAETRVRAALPAQMFVFGPPNSSLRIYRTLFRAVREYGDACLYLLSVPVASMKQFGEPARLRQRLARSYLAQHIYLMFQEFVELCALPYGVVQRLGSVVARVRARLRAVAVADGAYASSFAEHSVLPPEARLAALRGAVEACLRTLLEALRTSSVTGSASRAFVLGARGSVRPRSTDFGLRTRSGSGASSTPPSTPPQTSPLEVVRKRRSSTRERIRLAAAEFTPAATAAAAAAPPRPSGLIQQVRYPWTTVAREATRMRLHGEGAEPKARAAGAPAAGAANLVGSAAVWDEPLDAEGCVLYTAGTPRRLRAATLNQLIYKLTAESQHDMQFVKTFVTTFQSFATPHQLFDKLMERFAVPASTQLPGESADAWRKRVVIPIQLRVVNALTSVLGSAFADFDYELLLRVVDFAERHAERNQAERWPAQLLKLVHRRIDDERRQFTAAKALRPEPSLAHMTGAAAGSEAFGGLSGKVTKLALAQALTLLEFEVYAKIRPPELLNQAWNKAKLHHIAPNVIRLIELFNGLSTWVVLSVLRARAAKKRAAALAKWIGIARLLFEMNNFNTALAILSGINNAAVHRLRWTKEAVPARLWESFETMMRAFGGNNMAEYRAMLHRVNPPVLPYLGMYLTDLTFLEDANADTVGGLINFGKRELVYRVVSEVQQYQQTAYTFAVDAALRVQLERAVAEAADFGAAKLWAMSLEVEPRGEAQ